MMMFMLGMLVGAMVAMVVEHKVMPMMKDKLKNMLDK